MADFVNAKFDAEKNLTPFEILNMSGDTFKWVQRVGAPAYREIQRGLLADGVCACTGCCMVKYQRANAAMAKLSNEEAQHGKT